jgi:glycosyltransferase involved in cell wall biosynthesis
LRAADPLVSVIIPTYNRAKWVSGAVQSVIDQTYRSIEIIVVDDGSTDNTRDMLSEYGSSIKYIYQERSERCKARNRGFRHSRGEYIAFLDSDDRWLPTKIEQQVAILNNESDVGLVYTGVQFMDAKGNPHTGQISWDVPERQALYEDLMTHNTITGTTSSVMVRRTCLDKVGLFDELMNTCEDLDLYRRIARYYKFYKIDLPLVRFRIHTGSTQHDAAAMAKGWETTIRKIAEDTPAEFTYYKNQAIAKNLVQIAHLYASGGQLHRFFSFCVKAVFHRPNWILRYGFWRALLRLVAERKHSSSCRLHVGVNSNTT